MGVRAVVGLRLSTACPADDETPEEALEAMGEQFEWWCWSTPPHYVAVAIEPCLAPLVRRRVSRVLGLYGFSHDQLSVFHVVDLAADLLDSLVVCSAK